MVAEHEAKELLRGAGVPVPRGVVVRDMDFAPIVELREPLVLKAYGPEIVHKSEAGAVLGLSRVDVPIETQPGRRPWRGRPRVSG